MKQSGPYDQAAEYFNRGAYAAHGLKIFKIRGNEQIPLLDIPVDDLSVEWKALMAGSIVGEVQLGEPHLNLIRDVPQKTQTGAGVNWAGLLDRTFPVRINRFEIDDGEAVFYDFISDPKVDLRLRSIQLLATNLGTVRDRQDALPSSIHATATSIGEGRLTLDMKMNVLKGISDPALDLKFEDVRMPALNRLFQAYAKGTDYTIRFDASGQKS
jgi:hypothetical protein